MAEQIAFHGRIRRWKESQPGGLAVIDIPANRVRDIGGRRQFRVRGTLDGKEFRGSTMLVAGGGFCVGVSKAAMDAAGVQVGQDVEVTLTRAD
jgi:hypothetical protein